MEVMLLLWGKGAGNPFHFKNQTQRLQPLKRTYWTHANHPNFCRRAYEMLLLLQYNFNGKPHAITSQPHGNCKSGKAFTRTKPGVLGSIKRKVKGSAPPSQTQSLSEVPRNRKQVGNVKYKGREVQSQDKLFDLTLKSKDEEASENVYIRRLQVASVRRVF